MSRHARKLTLATLAALLLCCGILLGSYFASGATLSFSHPSPDGRERLDFYNATHWQALWINADMPGFVRLVRVAGDETLGTSPPFEMSGSGEVTWDADGVHVGASANFDRRTGRWSMDH